MAHRVTAGDLITSRREFLGRCGMGMGGLALGPLLRAHAGELQPHFAPKAKRVVHLFMNGGP